MATGYVNRTLYQIYDLIQTSGLHFLINSTPFSSYITIRKQLVNVDQIPLTDASSLIEPQQDDLLLLRDVLANLKSRNNSPEEALVNTKEDAKYVGTKTNEMFVNLHSKLDNLKTRNHSLGKEYANRDSKIEALEKEIKVRKKTFKISTEVLLKKSVILMINLNGWKRKRKQL